MNFSRFKQKRLLVGSVCLLALLIVAFSLQYRWISRASEAERQQRSALLEGSVNNFNNDLAATLDEIFLFFRPTLTAPNESGIAHRLREWNAANERAQMLREIIIGTIADQEINFEKLSRDGDAPLEAKIQADEIRPFRETIEFLQRGPQDRPPPFQRSIFWHVIAGKPTLILPLIEEHDSPEKQTLRSRENSSDEPPPIDAPVASKRILKAWCFFVLDQDYLTNTLLPEIVARNFGATGRSEYLITIITGEPPRVIYQSSPSAIDPSQLRADAEFRAPLFGAAPFFAGRNAFRSPDGRRPFPPFVGLRFPRRNRNASFGDPTTARVDEQNPPPEIRPEDWQLLLGFKACSLQALSEQARRRNLVIGFGVLLLLAGSIVLLGLSAQRAHSLAERQMMFVASVSHELRTPLAVIQSAGFNLASGKVGESERVRRYGETIQIETRRLIEQVEQMLSAAGIESSKKVFDVQALDLVSLLENVLRQYENRFESENWTVERDYSADLPLVHADALMVENIIKTLIQNALNYAHAGRWLKLTATTSSTARRANAYVLLSIADKGGGIAANDLPHIFDSFYRGASHAASVVRGSGLGLFLARHHARSLKGDLTVKNDAPDGAIFTLRLPASKAG